MGVVMKGGNSGCRHDYLAPVPSSGSSQPLLDTSGKEKQPGVYTQADDFTNKKNREQATPDFMPTSGGIPDGSTDVQEQGLPTSSVTDTDANIFKGAPDTGTKGGPAVPGHD